MKAAILHDWTIHMRGGEKVLEALAEIYPDAVIYTLFYDKRRLSASLQRMTFKTSWLQHIPGIRNFYRWLLPFLPAIAESMVIEPADLVISSSHCVIKGAKIPKNTPHLCYCHTPMRYIWGFESEYFGKFPKYFSPILNRILQKLRKWDLQSNLSVDSFIANSENVRERIRRYYGRDAHVIYPPLDSFYTPQENQSGLDGYYLAVSAFVPYKKLDIVIRAFNDLDRPLLIVGKGPMENHYRELRKSGKISFLGAVPDAELRKIYSGARALIFPTEEDFGIVPLEAQACGAPVIAYGKGGALESVKHGCFFNEQTPEAVRAAVLKFETMTFDRSAIPASVESFRKEHFKTGFQQFAEKKLRETHVAQ